MNLIRLTGAASAVIVVCGIIHAAQTQPQPSQPPASGRPKTFVGGGTHPFAGGISQNPWFNNPQVRQQLQLSGDQAKLLNKAYDEAWRSYYEGYNHIDKGLTDPQRRQQILELQKNFYGNFSGAPQKYLTNPQQLDRYNALHSQYQGYGAFTDPAIAGKLRLSPQQRTTLDLYQAQWETQMNKLNPLFLSNPKQAEQQFTKLQEQYAAQVNSALTPEQRTAWQQMNGAAFTFGPESFFSPNNAAPNSKP